MKEFMNIFYEIGHRQEEDHVIMTVQQKLVDYPNFVINTWELPCRPGQIVEIRAGDGTVMRTQLIADGTQVIVKP